MSNYIFKISQIEKYKSLIEKLSNASNAILLFSKDDMLLDAIAKLVCMKNECENQQSPCLYCSNCQKIIDKNALDVKNYGLEKSILVEDSQNIVEDSFVLPIEFEHKYFVLHNFEDATLQAQNKLLKVVEEPRDYVKFIILTKNLEAVLQTIRSRCEIYQLPKFEDEELKTVFDFDFGTGDKVNFAVQYADGNLTTLNAIYNDKKFAEIYSLCRNILINMRNSNFVLEFSSQIVKYKENIDTFFDILEVLYRDIISIKENKDDIVKNKQIINELKVLSNETTVFALLNILKEIQTARQSIKYNANIGGVVDTLLLKILEIKHLCK